MRIMSVVGARPQFVKLAPMDAAIRAAGHEHVIVHTGQHYAPELSERIFSDLGIPEPDVNLEVGSGGHAAQTAAMLSALGDLLERDRPDWVLVYGDTNSTVAAALAAVKLHIPLAHLEAGLRSGNRAMPEEHNRVATDHLADLLLAPTQTAIAHLEREGLASRSVLVGDVMVDVCLQMLGRVRSTPPAVAAGWPVEGPFALSTIHRAENTDDPARLGAVLDALRALPLPVVLAAHPRLVAKAAQHGLELAGGSLHTIDPLEYSGMVWALDRAVAAVTDSGGLQKEAYLVGTPCVTVRTETEWPETLVDGWNVVDPDLSTDLTVFAERRRSADRPMPFGDGRAAQRAVAAIEEHAAVG